MKIKKLLSLLAAAAMAVTSLTGAISVSAEEASGTFDAYSGQEYGANWTLSSDGVLTITGAGAGGVGSIGNTNGIASYQIKEIDIKEGITHIGQGCFTYLTQLTKMTIPSTVVYIDYNSLNGLSNPDLLIDCKMKCDTDDVKVNASFSSFAGQFQVHNKEAYDIFSQKSGLKDGKVIKSDDFDEGEPDPEPDPEVTVVASGTYDPYSGQTYGAKWTLDSNNVLTVTGAGEDGTGSIGGNLYKLGQYQNTIKEVVIEEGITHINDQMMGLFVCTKVTIPESVTELGNDAFSNFYDPDLVIDIKGTLTKIGRNAFSRVIGTIKVYNQDTYDKVAELATSAKMELVGDKREPATLKISLPKTDLDYGEDLTVTVEGNEGKGTVTFGLYSEGDPNCSNSEQSRNDFVTTGNIKYIKYTGTWHIRASVPQTDTHTAALSNILTVTISLTVDKTQLQAVYDEYKEKTQTNDLLSARSYYYTSDSYKPFGDAMDEAKGYLRSNEVTQDQLDASIDKIKEAFKGLKYDYATDEEVKALQDLIEKAKAINKYDYFKETWDATGFDKAIADAENVLTEFTMDGQEKPIHELVVSRTNSLNACFEKPLQSDPTKEGVWAELEEQIAEAKKAELEKDDFTTESYKPLGDLLAEVEGKTIHDMFRETIVSYIEQFKTAIAGLVIDQVLPTPGDAFLNIYTGGVEAYVIKDGITDVSLEGVSKIRFTIETGLAATSSSANVEFTAVVNGENNHKKFAKTNNGSSWEDNLELTLKNPIKAGQSISIWGSTLSSTTSTEDNPVMYSVTMVEFLDSRGRVLSYMTDITVAKDALTAAIAEGNALEEGNYTEDSYATLKKALDAAKALGDSATVAQCKAAKEAIDAAIEALVYKPADYTKVDEAIAKVPSDLSKYTEETAKAVTDAVAAVVRDKNITEQDVVDGYAKAIEDAIAGLQAKQTSSKTTSKTTNTTAKTTKATKATRSADAVKKDKSAAKKAMKQAKITKLTVKSKAKKINATWNKVKKAKGYEVQVSTNKKFKKSKIIFKKLTTKKKLTIKNKKIKSKKTYYVRVRAYATYKDTNNVVQKVYSAWNKKLRKVKVK